MSEEHLLADKPPISVWRRLVFASLGLFLVALVVGVSIAWFGGERGAEDRFTAIMAKLDAEEFPWKFADLDDARPNPPDVENSARVVVHVDKMLPRGWPDQKFDDQFQDVLPPELLDAERTKLLAETMKSLEPVLLEARKLAGMPTGRHKLVVGSNPLNAILKDQQDTRRSYNLLRYDAWDRATAGDMKGALLAGRAGINAARSLDDEPIIISQLVRIAGIAIACLAIERSLALGEAGDADLALLQQALALEEKHPTWLVCARGERAMSHATFEAIHSGEIPMQDVLGAGLMYGGSDLTWKERIFGISKSDMRRQHAILLEYVSRVVANARLPMHEQEKDAAVLDGEVRAMTSDARLVKMLLPAITTMSHATRRNAASVRCMMTLVAIERYRVKAKKWPEKLEELVPAYLDAVPLDPFDGKPLRYHSTDHGVMVYTTGQDRIDNGGALNRKSPVDPGSDWGYELWDVSKRRQPTRPHPAK